MQLWLHWSAGKETTQSWSFRIIVTARPMRSGNVTRILMSMMLSMNWQAPNLKNRRMRLHEELVRGRCASLVDKIKAPQSIIPTPSWVRPWLQKIAWWQMQPWLVYAYFATRMRIDPRIKRPSRMSAGILPLDCCGRRVMEHLVVRLMWRQHGDLNVCPQTVFWRRRIR